MCKKANYDGSDIESSKKFVICRNHEWVSDSGTSSETPRSGSSDQVLKGAELKAAMGVLKSNNYQLTGGHEDIVVSAGKTNPVKTGKDLSSDQYTKLVGIRLGPSLAHVKNISLDDLRKIASKLMICRCRSLKKVPLAEALVAYRAKEEQLAAAGLQDPINPTTGRVIRFNTCRYLNVMFGSVMKPKLANRGGRLTRRELEDKLRTDQNFAVSFLVEYNKRDEEAYGRLA